MSILKEACLNVMTSDMEKAVTFYSGIGLGLKQRWGDHYALMSGAGVNIGIHPSDNTNNSSGTVSFGFTVNDIDGAGKLLESKKITYSRVKDGNAGDILHFEDPDGTKLYFINL